jgi:hypothetical protein
MPNLQLAFKKDTESAASRLTSQVSAVPFPCGGVKGVGRWCRHQECYTSQGLSAWKHKEWEWGENVSPQELAIIIIIIMMIEKTHWMLNVPASNRILSWILKTISWGRWWRKWGTGKVTGPRVICLWVEGSLTAMLFFLTTHCRLARSSQLEDLTQGPWPWVCCL